MNKPTVSIKKAMDLPNHKIDFTKVCAKDGVVKHGIKYVFTDLTHYDLIDLFENARLQKGLTKAKVSKMAKLSKCRYNNFLQGSRLSQKSFNAFCKALAVLDQQTKTDFETVIEVCTLEKSIAMIKKTPINSDIVEMAVEIIKNAPESDDIFNLIYHLISRTNTYQFNVTSAIQIVKNSIQSTGKIHPILFHVFKNAGYRIQKSELIWKDVIVENNLI